MSSSQGAAASTPSPCIDNGQERRVGAALERLLLSLSVQEEAGLKGPPKLAKRPRASQFAARLVRYADRKWSGSPPEPVAWRRTLAQAAVVASLRLATGTLRRMGLGSILPFARERMRQRDQRPRQVAGYATTSFAESHVLRVSLLLRLMGYRAEAVRLLSSRYRAALPRARATELLATWLAQAGEGKAAAAMQTDAVDAADVPTPRRHTPRRLRYAVIVMTMFDSEVFRASVRSLLASDFDGEIVVAEDGNEPVEACREFAESVGARYVKNAAWSGCAVALNLGIGALGPDVDIVISSHSDVLWPPAWFRELDRVWDAVFDGDKVGLLNLGYLQFSARVDRDLRQLFVRGAYDDLVWVLRAIRELPALMNDVQDVQVRRGEGPFGLGRDPWIDWLPDLRQMTGRYSVAASFPVRVWRELGGFDPDLVYAFDLQLLHHNVARRRWALFVDNAPLVHLKSSDTESISAARTAEIGTKFLTSTYDGFKNKYGWHIEHYLNLYFSESTVIHRDAILDAANAFRFADIDFVFDDFVGRLASRTLDDCELTWCRSRASCPYAGAAAKTAIAGEHVQHA